MTEAVKDTTVFPGRQAKRLDWTGKEARRVGKGRIQLGAASGPLPSTIGSSWSKLPVGGDLENRPQNCPESGDAEPPGKALPGNNEDQGPGSR